MPPGYQLLYNDLLRDLERMQQRCGSEKEAAESCFWIASNYWEQLKKKTGINKFSSDAEEIIFFREVKPFFLRHAEYHIILSEALLFVPEDGAVIRDFWEEESKRLERVRHRNLPFVEYYESGCREQDAKYFLRSGHPGRKIMPLYDNDPDWCSPDDGTLRTWLAHQLYHGYTQQKLALLETESKL